MLYAQLLPTEAYIRSFRQTIPSSTKTASSIDRNASWLKIASSALQDGYITFAETLLLAYEQLLRAAV